MSAWTWTYVKAKSIPTDIVNKICDKSINDILNIWYYKKSKINFDETLKEWLENHDESYDYLVNECKISPDKMTHEYLEQDLKNKITRLDNYINDLSLVKEGKLTLDKCLRNHKVWKRGGLGYPCCYFINNTVWVNMPYEIFRLREYSNMFIYNGLKTIDDLIKYLSDTNRQHNLIWYENNNKKEGMFPEFELRLREYYGQFGDGNFSVYFG